MTRVKIFKKYTDCYTFQSEDLVWKGELLFFLKNTERLINNFSVNMYWVITA